MGVSSKPSAAPSGEVTRRVVGDERPADLGSLVWSGRPRSAARHYRRYHADLSRLGQCAPLAGMATFVRALAVNPGGTGLGLRGGIFPNTVS